jgi:Glutaredoxin-like domain (DUF836)
MEASVVTLIGKPGCHLCDDARATVEAVIAEVGSATLDEVSILDDAALFELYAEEIPVVLINGAVHTIWRVDPARLKNALLETQS